MVAKLKAGGDRPQYDIITLAGVGAEGLAAAGLLEKPDLNRIPNLIDVPEKYRTGANGHGIGYLLWCNSLVYSTRTQTGSGQLRRAVGCRSGAEHFPAAAELDRGHGPDHHRRQTGRW
jgi:hypothetical protein